MAEALYWTGLLLLGVLPGLLLVRAAALGWDPIESLAAAPGLSLGLVAFAAYAADALHLSVRPLPVLGLTAAILLLVWGAGRLGRRRHRPLAREAAAGPPRLDWLVLLVPVVAFVAVEPLRSLPLPPTIDDGLNHATWIRLIHDQAALRPSKVMEQLCARGAPSYPWGFHAWIALTGHVGPLPLMAVYSRGVQFLCCVLPLSVYVFSRRFLPRGGPCVAAAAAATLFWSIPQPVMWGGYALLAGSVSLPVLARMSLQIPTPWRVSPILASGIVGIGVLFIHPSQAMGALLVAGLAALVLSANRRLSWSAAIVFAFAIAAIGLLIIAARHLPAVSGLVRISHAGAQRDSLEMRIVHLKFFYLIRHDALPLLCGIGLLAAWFRPERRVLAALHVSLACVGVLGTAGETWLTLLWYHSAERLWYLQVVAVPPLAGLGLWTLIGGLSRAIGLLPRAISSLARSRRWPILCVAAILALLAGSIRQIQTSREFLTFVVRDYTWTDRQILVDAAWVEANLPARAKIINSPADRGIFLPLTGRLLAYPAGVGSCQRALPAVSLFDILRDPKRTSETISLSQSGFDYVIASRWEKEKTGSAFDVNALERNPNLEPLYRSAISAVFRVARTRRSFPHRLSYEVSNPRMQGVLTSGWSGLERNEHRSWVWSDAATSTLTFAIGPGDEPYVLTLHGGSILPSLTIEAAISDTVVGSTRLLQGQSTASIAIPAGKLQNGTNVIELRYSQTAVPPGGHDPRHLALSISRVELAPAAKR